jgi:hypothetical protein
LGKLKDEGVGKLRNDDVERFDDAEKFAGDDSVRVGLTKTGVVRHQPRTPSSPTPIGDPGERSECFWCLRRVEYLKVRGLWIFNQVGDDDWGS